MDSSNSPENPHLTDIFRTALSSPSPAEAETKTPRIVVNGNNNVVAFGGRVVINERARSSTRRPAGN